MPTLAECPRHPTLSGLLLLFLCVAGVSPRVHAQQDDSSSPPGCLDSAQVMDRSCRLDARAERTRTVAACLNIVDGAQRTACREHAAGTFDEAVADCEAVTEARRDVCDLLGEGRYDPDPLLDPSLSFIDPDDIPAAYAPNPYMSLAAGTTALIRAGENGEETNVVYVTDQAREIEGVSCRIVVDAVLEPSEDEEGPAYVPVELTDDMYAQDTAGNVYYCGELSRTFEDGRLHDLEGSFEAGQELAKAGLLLRAVPAAGAADRQEFALGVAEDIVEYRNLAAVPPAAQGGENPAFPCAPDGCLKTHESSPLEPDSSEFKYYIPGTGFVLAVALEDGRPTGEREELVCTGSSLDILSGPDCGVEDADALRAALCRLSPDTMCPQ